MKNFSNFHFSGQKPGEQILLIMRRHWFDVFLSLSSVLVMLFILLGSYVVLPILFPVLRQALFAPVFAFLENLFALALFILFFLIWIDYYFDIWIITNKRIVNVEQNGLFSREVSELELENIQDITTEVLGIIPTFLNYGNVYVQTAAEKTRFVFENVPDPYGAKDLIMNLQNKEERASRNELGNIIYKKIRQNGV